MASFHSAFRLSSSTNSGDANSGLASIYRGFYNDYKSRYVADSPSMSANKLWQNFCFHLVCYMFSVLLWPSQTANLESEEFKWLISIANYFQWKVTKVCSKSRQISLDHVMRIFAYWCSIYVVFAYKRIKLILYIYICFFMCTNLMKFIVAYE